MWSIDLYGADTWALREVDQRHLKRFEMWCWRRMEKIILTDCVKNLEVLQRAEDNINILQTVKGRTVKWIGHILRKNGLLNTLFKKK
jgi:hypothetical protein